MKMQLRYAPPKRDIVLTMGVFDGVHLGHRHLAQQVVGRARERGCLSGAITFHPHPRTVVMGDGPPYLCTLDERLALLRGLGLDVVEALPFTLDLAQLSALEFMSLLCQSRRLRELWVGSDFALGHRREGNVTRLTEIGHDLGYQVQVVPPLVVQGRSVSSTLIREFVREGQVEAAARLLKRRHNVGGIAMPGDQRHWRPGFPTANVAVYDGAALPAGGVYLAYVRWKARRWSTIAHLTSSCASSERRLEIHTPNLADDLCGHLVSVEFARRLLPDVSTQTLKTHREKVPVLREVLSPDSLAFSYAAGQQ